MYTDPGYELLEKYSTLVEKHSIKNELEDYYDSLCAMAKPNVSYWDTTGFPALDQFLDEGLGCKNELITICARPSVGKTAFAVSLIRNMLTRDKRILFFSLEMSCKDIIDRLVASISRVSLYNIVNRRFSGGQFDRVARAIEYLWNRHLYIVDIPNVSTKALWDIILTTTMMEMHRPDCILIDHFGLIRGRASSSDEYDSPSGRLKSIASCFSVPVFVMYQLQHPNSRREPTLAELPCVMKFLLVEDSDAVLFLHRHKSQFEVERSIMAGEDDEKPQQVAKIIIAKNGNGNTGHIFVGFNSRTDSFEDIG